MTNSQLQANAALNKKGIDYQQLREHQPKVYALIVELVEQASTHLPVAPTPKGPKSQPINFRRPKSLGCSPQSLFNALEVHTKLKQTTQRKAIVTNRTSALRTYRANERNIRELEKLAGGCDALMVLLESPSPSAHARLQILISDMIFGKSPKGLQKITKEFVDHCQAPQGGSAHPE